MDFEKAGRWAAWGGGVITLTMGVLVLNAPYLATSALVILLAGWFGLDAVREFINAVLRRGERRSAGMWALAAAGNLLACVLLVALREQAAPWVIAVTPTRRVNTTAAAAARSFTDGTPWPWRGEPPGP